MARASETHPSQNQPCPSRKLIPTVLAALLLAQLATAHAARPGADKTKLAVYLEVSPVNYLKPDSPPLLMIQGDQDTTIPVQHGHYLKQQLDRSLSK